MSKKIKATLWVIITYIGIPLVLINTKIILNSWNYCGEKNFFYNVRYVYKHYDFAEGSITRETRETDECPHPPWYYESPLYIPNTEESRDLKAPL